MTSYYDWVLWASAKQTDRSYWSKVVNWRENGKSVYWRSRITRIASESRGCLLSSRPFEEHCLRTTKSIQILTFQTLDSRQVKAIETIALILTKWSGWLSGFSKLKLFLQTDLEHLNVFNWRHPRWKIATNHWIVFTQKFSLQGHRSLLLESKLSWFVGQTILMAWKRKFSNWRWHNLIIWKFRDITWWWWGPVESQSEPQDLKQLSSECPIKTWKWRP